jgi:adenylate cyclase
MLVEFPSAVEAVQAAIEIQRDIEGRNAELAEARHMHFRIGVNLGDVIEEEDGTIYGDGVNIAARMEALADSGGVCISSTVFDAVEGKLDFGFDFIGEQHVKNIERPISVYRVRSEPGAKSARPAKPLHKPVLIAVAVLVIVGIAGIGVWQLTERSNVGPEVVVDSSGKQAQTGQDAALALPAGPSIAVLPFTNMSGDPEQEYFSDGITDDIITDLSKLQGLMVIARNSTFTYKGKAVDVRQVGRELGVRHVLEGGVRKFGGRVRITAQLVDATNGDHVWSERYDRPLKDIFALQDEITEKIVLALNVHLLQGDDARMWRESTENPEAYDYYLRGWNADNMRPTRENLIYAEQMFEKALELDPEYALAMVQLGWLEMEAAGSGWREFPDESREKAREWANRALELDSSLGDAYSLLSMFELGEENHEQAIALARQAVDLIPSSTNALALLSWPLSYSGKAEEGLKTMEKALRLNPFPPAWYYHGLGVAYLLMGKFDRSIEAYRECLSRAPEYVFCHINLTIAYMGAGKKEQGSAQAKELLLFNPSFTTDHVAIRRIKDPTVRERFKTFLRQAGLE